MVYLKSVENVITLGKLIGLLFLFCLPLLSILFLKTKRNDLARPVMGTIFLVRDSLLVKITRGYLKWLWAYGRNYYALQHPSTYVFAIIHRENLLYTNIQGIYLYRVMMMKATPVG